MPTMLCWRVGVLISVLAVVPGAWGSILGTGPLALPVFGYANSTDRATLHQLLTVEYTHIVVGGGTGEYRPMGPGLTLWLE